MFDKPGKLPSFCIFRTNYETFNCNGDLDVKYIIITKKLNIHHFHIFYKKSCHLFIMLQYSIYNFLYDLTDACMYQIVFPISSYICEVQHLYIITKDLVKISVRLKTPKIIYKNVFLKNCQIELEDPMDCLET